MGDTSNDDYEYERRWLVPDPSIVDGHRGTLIAQAYLMTKDGWTVRVRRSYAFGPIRPSDEYEGSNTLAIKGPRVDGRRIEIEEEIDGDQAKNLFRQARYRIFKTRFNLIEDGLLYDVDVFDLPNSGLIIAERESSGGDDLPPPSWCGREITEDTRFNNENLAEQPFDEWLGDDDDESRSA